MEPWNENQDEEVIQVTENERRTELAMDKEQEMAKAAGDFKDEGQDYKYIAFISYRHIEPDADVAKAIHTMVETFQPPKEFYVDGKKPNFRVFRDREELSTTSLSASIKDALLHSKYLIVICSKRLQESRWCNEEVETFIRLHGVDRVIPVLIEGEPEDSFPKVLLGGDDEVQLADGTNDEEKKDILGAELRSEEVMDPSFEGFQVLEQKDPKEVDRLGKKAAALLKTEKYRIMAAILGVSYGDLRQRDKERRQRRMLLTTAALSVLFLFFAFFMYDAYVGENLAKRQTIQDRSSFMLDEADSLVEEGDRFEAILLSHDAMADLDEGMENYDLLKSRHHYLLNNTATDLNTTYDRTISTNNRFTFLDFYPDGSHFVAGLDNNAVGAWESKTGNLVKRMEGHSQQVKLVDVSADQKHMLSGGFDDVINRWSLEDFSLLDSVKTPGNVMLMNYSDDGSHIDVIYDTVIAYYYQRYDVEGLVPVGEPIALRSNISRVSFNAQGTAMWVMYETYLDEPALVKLDLSTGQLVKEYENVVYDEIAYTFDYMSTSKAGDYLYLGNGREILRLDMETDEIEVIIDDEASDYYQDYFIVDSTNKDYFYINSASFIRKYDWTTGEELYQITSGTETIAKMQLSDDGRALLVLYESGNMATFVDDKSQQIVTNNSENRLEYAYLSPDNKTALALSLNDQKIMLAGLGNDDAMPVIDAQIAGTSENQQFTLYFANNAYYIWDNTAEEKVRDIEHPYLRSELAYLLEGNRYSLSNDGKFVSGVYDNSGSLTIEEAQIFVLDTTTNEIAYSFPVPSSSFILGFSADGGYLFLTTAYNEITIHNVLSQFVEKTIEVDPGFIMSVRFSADNKYMIINYIEGVSNVYLIDDGNFVGSVPGEILQMEEDEEGSLEISAVYNDVGSKYVDFQMAHEVAFEILQDELGSTSDDRYHYNPNSGLLFVIKSREEKNRLYVVDFDKGYPIKTLDTMLSTYKPTGFISPEGDKIIFDYSFDAFLYPDFNSEGHPKVVVYPLTDYETLVEESKTLVDGVEVEETENTSEVSE